MLHHMNWPLLSENAIAEGLATKRVGVRLRVVAETASTNDVALAAADAGPDCDGLAVFADYQTAGRGRQGRSWHAPRGASLLCSTLVFGPDDMSQAGLLTLVAGIAACDAVREATTVWPVLHWPNDLFVGGKKLAGVLVESRPVGERRAWVIGVGVNCYQHASHFPPEIRDRATSLELESHEPIDRLRLAKCLLHELDRWLADEAAWSADRVRSAWVERAEALGARVRLACDAREYSGRAVDVDPPRGLLVQLDDGARVWFDAARSQIVSWGDDPPPGSGTGAP
jgi:BirA family biotin operon repressor/biotin-[acetyl-CoA-carboxylase] ligase